MAKKSNRLEKLLIDREFSIENLLFREKLKGANEFLVYEVLSQPRGVREYVAGETRPDAATYQFRGGGGARGALDFAEGYVAGFRSASS